MMQSHVLYRDLMRQYPNIVRAEGSYIYGDDGKRYLDACGTGAGAISSIGYGRREIAEAMATQVQKVTFLHGGSFRTPAVETFAEQIISMAPPGMSRVWLVSGGSEAVESAIKLARQYQIGKGYPNRWRVIARRQNFHGVTLGALSSNGIASNRSLYEPLLFDFPHIVTPYCYRCFYPDTHPNCGARYAAELEDQILKSGPETVAAFIAEPITGSCIIGQLPPPDYMARIREICDRYDILFIVDEIQTAFGRTGENFAIDHWGVIPDIITFAKGVSGGYCPLGGMVVSDKIAETLIEKFQGRFHHGHSFNANPMSAAVGSAVLNIIQRDNLVVTARERGNYLRKCLLKLAEEHSSIGDVRGLGLQIGVEFVNDKQTKTPYSPDIHFARQLSTLLLSKGVIVSASSGPIEGGLGDEIRITPSMTITQSEIDELIEAIDQVLTELETRL